ncbi:MAG: AtzH-like domain-containing protein [Nostoc sp.]
MTTINDPTVVTEVTDLYLKYEEALCNNNLEVMDQYGSVKAKTLLSKSVF